MKKIALLSLGPIADPAARERIARWCDITETTDISEEALFGLIPEFEAVIVPFTAEQLVSRRVIDAGTKLRLIASTYGGTRQNIEDLYALEKGITLIHTGATRARPMAEYTLGLILSSLLRIHNYHHDMVSGEAWPRFKYPRTRILSGRTAAVIGYGRIGSAIAELLKGFARKKTESAGESPHEKRAAVAAGRAPKRFLRIGFDEGRAPPDDEGQQHDRAQERARRREGEGPDRIHADRLSDEGRAPNDGRDEKKNRLTKLK